jgi:ketosteroid isomerase-like protein
MSRDPAQARRAATGSERSSQENVEVVLRMHHAVVRGDVDGFLAEVHPEGEYIAAIQQAMEGADGVIRGHEGLRRWLSDLHDLYEEFDTEILEVRDAGSQVVISFVVQGRGRGSGVTLEQPLAQVVTLRDGKAVQVRDYFSAEEAFDAVELSG